MNLVAFFTLSSPGSTRRSMLADDGYRSGGMDARVKPGHDMSGKGEAVVAP
jgi:hypothetical protein